ncbi:YiiX/YebB-like N1pC/P60 family cysteine hydrolase [Chitinibacteraceae bacterium HSL-7]
MKWMLFGVMLMVCAGARADQQAYQGKIAEMLALRAEAYQFAEQNGILERETPSFTRRQGDELRALALRYLAARGELLPYVDRVAPCFKAAMRINWQKPTTLPANCGTSPQVYYTINPGDAAGRAQMRRILPGFASALVLMDSYQIAVEPYATNPAIRYLFNYDIGDATHIDRLTERYRSPVLRGQLRTATRLVDDYFAGLRQRGLTPDADEQYWLGLIQSTAWYALLHNPQWTLPLDAASNTLDVFALQRMRTMRALSFGVSAGFGQMVGYVQTRSGKLKNMRADELAELKKELKPLDVLLEKTPFRLTDKMIPGYYGHVAVWLGSEAELREVGAWDRIPPRWQQEVREGKRIVEALRSGVTLSTLEHFLDIDDLLVLRDTRETDAVYRRQALITAADQLGKPYDFNFDVLTHQRIVCSELAYVVFPDVAWPLAQTLGRYTISPDNVAQMAVGQSPVFKPVVMYRDGRREASPSPDLLRSMIAIK